MKLKLLIIILTVTNNAVPMLQAPIKKVTVSPNTTQNPLMVNQGQLFNQRYPLTVTDCFVLTSCVAAAGFWYWVMLVEPMDELIAQCFD